MLKKILDISDTPEGWAVGAGLIWALLAAIIHIPLEATIPGIGHLSAATLLAFGGAFVLAKLGWTIPFRPVLPGEMPGSAREVGGGYYSGPPSSRNSSAGVSILLGLAILVTLLGVAASARAADGDPDWVSLRRLSGGLTAQASVYSNSVTSGNPAPLAAFAPKAWLSYSLLDEVSAHASYQKGFGPDVDELHAGGAVRLLKEDPVRVSIAVDAVRLYGAGARRLAHQDVVEYSLRFSKVLKRSAGAPRLGIQYQPGYVPANKNYVHRLGINWTGFGGG